MKLKKITSKTRAIIVVHLGGNPAEIIKIVKLACKYHLYIIEVCAQSYMSYSKGKLLVRLEI